MSIYIQRYNKLINHYKENPILDGYVEKHHILPKCLGGNNDADNIVSLPAKAHYLAHLLLTKIYNNSKIKYAFWCMSFVRNDTGRNYITAARYSKMKKCCAEAARTRETGKKASKETREKLSRIRKGVPKSEQHKKNLIPAAKKNLKKAVEANIKRGESEEPYFSDETRKFLSDLHKGNPKTEEAKRKMSIAAKKSNHGFKNVSKAYRKVTCIKCKKTMIYSNYIRHHNH